MALRDLVSEKASNSKAPRRSPPFVWTLARERQLIELWATGASGDAIAASIHPELSRSAVLGKVDRLRKAGLPLGHRVENGRVTPTRMRSRKVAPGTKVTKLPQLQQPPMMDFSDGADLDTSETTRMRTVPLPPITAERIHARHQIEAVHEERRLAPDELRCICGKPGAIHCHEHRRLLQREGVL